MQPLYRTSVTNQSKYSKVLGHDSQDKEIWANDTYTVIVNRNQQTPFEIDGKKVTMCWLSIRRNDREAIPDWRDFQWIKNQLVGEENEGCELYPAESRLVDSANQYHVYVFETTRMQFPFGFDERMVADDRSKFPNSKQRDFPKDREPKDLEEMNAKVREILSNADKELNK